MLEKILSILRGEIRGRRASLLDEELEPGGLIDRMR